MESYFKSRLLSAACERKNAGDRDALRLTVAIRTSPERIKQRKGVARAGARQNGRGKYKILKILNSGYHKTRKIISSRPLYLYKG